MPVAVQSAHRRLNVIIMAPFVKYRQNRATSRGGGERGERLVPHDFAVISMPRSGF